MQCFGRIGLFEMPEKCGGEIDTELDFQILEKIEKGLIT